jgi:hypothetical protein
MASQATPNWQPITQLPLIASLIDGMLHEALEQYELIRQATSKPWILDDYTVGRVIKVFTEQNDYLGLYQEQMNRWGELSLKENQHMEIDRLNGQLDSLRTAVAGILTLADKLKAGTIEREFSKNDTELGLEMLLRLFRKP